MPRVITHTDVEALADGATLSVEPDAMVTPLALERAREKGVLLTRDAADESLIEAVIAKVADSLGVAPAQLTEVGPGIDFCQMCLEQERARSRSRAVLTTTGRNQKGIVARVTARIADLGGDILDISQTLVGDYFTMIIVVDTASLGVPFADFKGQLEEEVREMGLQCMMMHEDVVSSLHRI